MADLLKKHYGNISPETTIKYITAQHQTGDMHIAIYDYANMHLYAQLIVNSFFPPKFSNKSLYYTDTFLMRHQ